VYLAGDDKLAGNRSKATGMTDRTPRPAAQPGWDSQQVRALRAHLGASQQQLADRLGTRQQTVSEWETASSSPRRMSRRLLTMVAEEAGFYAVRSGQAATGGAALGRAEGGPVDAVGDRMGGRADSTPQDDADLEPAPQTPETEASDR